MALSIAYWFCLSLIGEFGWPVAGWNLPHEHSHEYNIDVCYCCFLVLCCVFTVVGIGCTIAVSDFLRVKWVGMTVYAVFPGSILAFAGVFLVF